MIEIPGTKISHDNDKLHNNTTNNFDENKNKDEDENFNYSEYPFVQPTYVDEKLNLTNFNFKGKCREPFKYKPNNKRDLLFTGIKYTQNWLWERDKEQIRFTSTMMKNTIPFAKRVCVIYGNDDNLKSFIESCGFEVVQIKCSANELRNINSAIDRFIQLDKYLMDHEGEFDRVALVDSRDVFFFADGFQTISEDEVVFCEECVRRSKDEYYCIDFTQEQNYGYVRDSYGADIAEEYRKDRKSITNVGIIIGGIKPFTQLLKIFVEEIHRKQNYLHKWGIDNAMINYLRYSGAFKDINVNVNMFSQRVSFVWMYAGGYIYDFEKKSITNTLDGCSPIIRHKLGGNTNFELGI